MVVGDKMWQKLGGIAKELELSRSAVIRNIISEFFDNYEQKKRREMSYDPIKDSMNN
jgi:metal-responsive CopG/Arc/MetJ family transcriptional regulator